MKKTFLKYHAKNVLPTTEGLDGDDGIFDKMVFKDFFKELICSFQLLDRVRNSVKALAPRQVFDKHELTQVL